MLNFLKRKPLIIETPSERPQMTEAVLNDLKYLPHRDGFKFILASLRFQKATSLAMLGEKDNPDLRADVRAINRLERDLQQWAQQDFKKPRLAESEEERLFKKVSAATQIV